MEISGDFINKNLMGPSSYRIIEEISTKLKIDKKMRVLDLGCGNGLTSIFLANNFQAQIFAFDLWISATDNYGRIKNLGFDDRIIPIHGEAHDLPFSNNYFDLIISIDAYHYFGYEPGYLTNNLVALLKPNGRIAVAIPGIKAEFDNGIPKELIPFWRDDFIFHSCKWWRELWKNESGIRIDECTELKCVNEAWDDWLKCDNEHAKEDIAMMKAENGNYFNLVYISGTKV
jgi:cyclopropane fatty-acyl-phospholipid synthase-like methyltransferase